MKRLVFLILLVAVAFWILARHRHEHAQMRFEHPVQAHWRSFHQDTVRTVGGLRRRIRSSLPGRLPKPKRLLAEAQQGVKTAVSEARA